MYQELFSVFIDEKKALEYLISCGLINPNITCFNCQRFCKIDLMNKVYRCNKSGCRKKVSIFKNTFFSTCKIPLNEILLIVFQYLMKTPTTSIMEITTCSSHTVCTWTKYLRDLCSKMLDPEDVVIGGPGVIVEIDETKLGKRKFNRDHHVEGVWCIVGVERTNLKRSFVIPVENRNSDTIKRIIDQNVIPGSIIYTDCWAAYVGLCSDLGFEHRTVNHTLWFKDPNTVVHTNTVEGVNNGIKTFIKQENAIKKTLNHILDFIYGIKK